MNLPNYRIENEQWALRWGNRKDFLKKEKKIRHKKNKVAIICIFFKSFDNIRILSEYIIKEKYSKDFDFIIINNSPDINIDFEKELNNENMIILSAITNLWTDGWYSIWLEYTIHNGYEYVFVVEDDVVFLDDQTFSTVYEKMNKNSLWFLSSLVNYKQPHSRYVQFACYPIDFLKKCGTIDPRFFTRWGDGERAPRIEKTMKKYWYKEIIVNKKHFHPYLKKNNRSSWRIYFVRRNLLWSIKKTKKLSITNMLLLFMYIWSWYTKLFFGKSGNDVKALYLAIKDFLLAPKTLDLSLNRMNQLYSIPKDASKDEQDVTISINRINDYVSGLFILWSPSPSWLWISWFTNQDLKHIQRSTRISAFLKKGMVIPNINSPLYPIALLSKKIVAINEFDICKNTANISIFQNKKRFRTIKIIKIAVALLLWIITFILTITFIFIKIITYMFFKK